MSFVVTSSVPDAVQVTAGDFNTGNYIFTQMPIYFSYSPTGGTIFFNPRSTE